MLPSTAVHLVRLEVCIPIHGNSTIWFAAATSSAFKHGFSLNLIGRILSRLAIVCMQSAVLGFGVFRVLERYGVTSGLSIGENVILQTTSVATATMPLAAGKEAYP